VREASSSATIAAGDTTMTHDRASHARRVTRLTLAAVCLGLAMLGASAAPASTSGEGDAGFAVVDTFVETEMQALAIPGLALGVSCSKTGSCIFGASGSPIRAGDQSRHRRPFILTSTSKAFTALAVMQLVEAGNVELGARSNATCRGSALPMRRVRHA
jgi:CubicO group peptidase (beta-lactamase class C family)